MRRNPSKVFILILGELPCTPLITYSSADEVEGIFGWGSNISVAQTLDDDDNAEPSKTTGMLQQLLLVVTGQPLVLTKETVASVMMAFKLGVS